MKDSECKDLFAMLSEYLDHELPDSICHEIDAHISSCPPCVQFVESLRKTVSLCRSLDPGAPSGPLQREAREELLACYRRMLAERERPSAGSSA
jgi:RNA polymerase sigma-70 factor (ECF subfamily)